MKGILLFIVLSIQSIICIGQKEYKYLIGADASYLYFYSANDGDMQDFNYEANVFISPYIAKVKVSLGIGYSTFNIHSEFDSSDNVADGFYKVGYKAQFLNIPILLTFNKRFDRKYNFSPYIGAILNHAIDYDEIRYFTDKSPEIDGTISWRNPGLTLRIGTNLSKVIHPNVALTTALFADFKAVSNQFYRYKSYYPEGRLAFGLKIGIDYLL